MVKEPYKVPIRDIIVDKTVDAMTVKTDHLSFLHGPNKSQAAIDPYGKHPGWYYLGPPNSPTSV